MISSSALNYIIFVPRFLPTKAYGAVVYLRNTLEALLPKLEPANVIIMCNSESKLWFSKHFPSAEIWSVRVPTSNILGVLTDYFLLIRALLRFRKGTFFFPLNIKPSLPVAGSVLMLHDLAAEFYGKHYPAYQPLFYFVQRRLVRSSLFTCSHIVVPSKAILNEVLNKFPALRGKITVIPEGVKKIAPKVSGEITSNKIRLLQTGAKLPHKSQHTTIEALAVIQREHPKVYRNLILTILGGSSSELKDLKDFAKDVGVEEVITFEGKVDEGKLDWYLIESDLHIFPSLYEGFGLGVLEARAIGKPFIASDIPVFREVGGDVGVYFKPASSEALAQAICDFANKYSTSIAHEPTQESLSLPSWEAHGEQLVRVLRQF